jgi:hypothetical protein
MKLYTCEALYRRTINMKLSLERRNSPYAVACMPHLDAGTGVRRQGLALSIEAN